MLLSSLSTITTSAATTEWKRVVAADVVIIVVNDNGICSKNNMEMCCCCRTMMTTSTATTHFHVVVAADVVIVDNDDDNIYSNNNVEIFGFVAHRAPLPTRAPSYRPQRPWSRTRRTPRLRPAAERQFRSPTKAVEAHGKGSVLPAPPSALRRRTARRPWGRTLLGHRKERRCLSHEGGDTGQKQCLRHEGSGTHTAQAVTKAVETQGRGCVLPAAPLYSTPPRKMWAFDE